MTQQLQPLVGSYGNPAATNQRDYWRVALQLVMRAKVDLGMLVLMSAVLIPLDIHVKDWLLSQKAVAVLGIAMSIFIGFRNTQAISRWWEARKLLGTVWNKSRVWTDDLRGLLNEQQWRSPRTQQLVQLQVAIVWQMNFQLRNFLHPDLYLMRQQLLDQLALPATEGPSFGSLVLVQKVHKNPTATLDCPHTPLLAHTRPAARHVALGKYVSREPFAAADGPRGRRRGGRGSTRGGRRRI